MVNDSESKKVYQSPLQLNKKEDKVKMDYQSEQKRLEEGGNYWKPKVGQHKVKALTELQESDPYIRKHKDAEDEVSPQSKMGILVDGEEKIWTFAVGQTPASTYGQLVDLATRKNNILKDVEFSVVVVSDGDKNTYTIVE